MYKFDEPKNVKVDDLDGIYCLEKCSCGAEFDTYEVFFDQGYEDDIAICPFCKKKFQLDVTIKVTEIE